LKICLLLEGSYPHITGGVSTWAQIIIRNLSEHKFILYTIGAEERSLFYILLEQKRDTGVSINIIFQLMWLMYMKYSLIIY
jgi:hypothetical protein